MDPNEIAKSIECSECGENYGDCDRCGRDICDCDRHWDQCEGCGQRFCGPCVEEILSAGVPGREDLTLFDLWGLATGYHLNCGCETGEPYVSYLDKPVRPEDVPGGLP